MPGSRDKTLILFLGVALSLSWLFLSRLSHGIDLAWLPASWQAGFAYEVDNNLMPTGTYLVVHLVSSVALIFVVFRLRDRSIGWVPIVFFALLVRLCAIPGEPIHESDFYRYLWDGKSAGAEINPYRFEPGALYLHENGISTPFDDPSTGVTWQAREFSIAEEESLSQLASIRDGNPVEFSRVSHPAVPTIYPPVAQWVFFLTAAVSGWSAVGLKLVLLLFDMGIVCLLVGLLKRLGRNPIWALLYAWNPLVIKEFANSAHYDAIPVFFCLAGLWIAVVDQNEMRRAILIGVALALGFLAKYFAILLLPVLLMAPFSSEKTGLLQICRAARSLSVYAGVVAFVLTAILGFVPFAYWDDIGIGRLFAGLAIYREHWQYNPGVFALLRRGLEIAGDTNAFRHAGWISGVLLVGVVLWQSLRRGGEPVILGEKCLIVISALFVLSPTAFPWYLCWVLVFLPIRPRWSWLILGVLWPLNYLDFKSTEVAPIAHWSLGGFYVLSGSIWLFFLVMWAAEYARGKSRCHSP